MYTLPDVLHIHVFLQWGRFHGLVGRIYFLDVWWKYLCIKAVSRVFRNMALRPIMQKLVWSSLLLDTIQNYNWVINNFFLRMERLSNTQIMNDSIHFGISARIPLVSSDNHSGVTRVQVCWNFNRGSPLHWSRSYLGSDVTVIVDKQLSFRLIKKQL